MATATYALKDFIADVDRIARDETSAQVITERVAPLLAKLVKNPDAVPTEFRRRPEGGLSSAGARRAGAAATCSTARPTST